MIELHNCIYMPPSDDPNDGNNYVSYSKKKRNVILTDESFAKNRCIDTSTNEVLNLDDITHLELDAAKAYLTQRRKNEKRFDNVLEEDLLCVDHIPNVIRDKMLNLR